MAYIWEECRICMSAGSPCFYLGATEALLEKRDPLDMLDIKRLGWRGLLGFPGYDRVDAELTKDQGKSVSQKDRT